MKISMKTSDYNNLINQLVSSKNKDKLEYTLSTYDSTDLSEALKLQIIDKFPDIAHLLHESPPLSKEVEFEIKVAKKFTNKYNNAIQRGIPFSLTLTSIKNILRAKKCYYSGMPLTEETSTIDRIDHTKGYEKGNVVACHTSINKFKNIIESGNTEGIDLATITRVISKWNKAL